MNRDRLTPLGRRIHVGMVSVDITTESELARRAGISHQTVRRLLYEDIVRVDASTLFRLADTLRTSARWILSGAGYPTPRLPLTPGAQRLVEIHAGLSPKARSILLNAATDLMVT